MESFRKTARIAEKNGDLVEALAARKKASRYMMGHFDFLKGKWCVFVGRETNYCALVEQIVDSGANLFILVDKVWQVSCFWNPNKATEPAEPQHKTPIQTGILNAAKFAYFGLIPEYWSPEKW